MWQFSSMSVQECIPAFSASHEQLGSTELLLWDVVLSFLGDLAEVWTAPYREKICLEIRGSEKVLMVFPWVLVSLLLGSVRDDCVLVTLPSWLLHFSFLDS